MFTVWKRMRYWINFKGLSIRKRFRATTRHTKGKGLIISIQTIAGHTLFACTVGDLGHVSGIGDVSLDSWACLEGMINIVRRTGHSSFYVEKGMNAMNKTPKQMGIQIESLRVNGGGRHLPPVYTMKCWLSFPSSLSNMAGGRPIRCQIHLNKETWPLSKNAPCCPIAIAAAYSGSSQEDHNVSVLLDRLSGFAEKIPFQSL